MQLFLTLLRIIGILILAVILLVLLVVLLVLLCPVRYRAIVARELDKNPEVTARVTWLLHFLSVRVDYKEKLSYRVSVLGFTLLKDDDILASKNEMSENVTSESMTSESETSDDAAAESDLKSETIADPTSGREHGEKENAPSAEEKPTKCEKTAEPEVKSDRIEKSTTGKDIETETEVPETDDQKVPLGEKISHAVQFIAGLLNELHGAIPEKIAEFLEKTAAFIEKISLYPDTILEKVDELQKKKERLLKQINDVQNQSAVKAVFGTIGSLLVHIKPQKLKIEGRLGFDDPATTGQIFGVIGMLMPLYGETIHLEAVFHEAVAEGKLEVKGRIRIGTALYMVLKLIGKKEVRRLIAQVKRLKKA